MTTCPSDRLLASVLTACLLLDGQAFAGKARSSKSPGPMYDFFRFVNSPLNQH